MPLSVAPELTLYFCRHGETEANVEHRFQGRTIDTPLTDKGRQQASAIASNLKRCEPGPERLRYVSSPLPRARTTMELIRLSLDLDPKDYALDDRLLEIDLGAWDGMTEPELRAKFPQEYETRTNDKWNARVPGGGENYADVARRAESWVAELQADTFAVSHGAFTRILRGLFAGLGWKQMSDLDEKQGVLFRVRGSTVERFDPPDA
ncbi:MAG: histidine phosphatase family protein [Rhizomicrobium sp.]|jgi:probable phosphoglycerate mutase